MKIRPVILSGGSGTRMWPISRARYPKQFAALAGETTLFARTLALIGDRKRFAAPVIVANQEHKFLVLDALARQDIKDATVLLEPIGRNTAAAALAAALAETADDAIHLVLPSDHIIGDPKTFLNLVTQAAQAAGEGHFVLFGIKPDHPETGYGYIIPGKARSGTHVHTVSRFVEKPPVDKARAMMDEGALWNSGIFVYAPQTLRDEAEKLTPKTLQGCAAALKASKMDLGCIMLAAEPYEKLPNDAIDRAIMEKTARATVIPGDFKWSDVGSWQTLWQIAQKNADDNALVGPVIAKDVKGSYLRSYGPSLAVMGMEDVAVVATKDAVLVAPLSRAQDVRDLAAAVSKTNSTLGIEHPKVLRPWGSYEGVAVGERFQVKEIIVLPGRSLSQQKHHHRSEHWVVVAGTAKVECNGEEKLLYPNQSCFIPIGSVHRLSNPGKVDLHLIEVQSGDYIGEDDIVRFSDDYGRGDAIKPGTEVPAPSVRKR